MFKMTLKAPRLFWNSAKFTAAIREKVREQLREAAKEFVMAAVVKVPIDTGQARGTFLPLGRFLNVTVPISGGEPTSKKNPETGARDHAILFRFSSNQYGEYFEIDPQLFYFWWNDFFDHDYANGQAWRSMEEGTEAFVRYMREVAPNKLPKLKKFLEFYTFDPSSGGQFGG